MARKFIGSNKKDTGLYFFGFQLYNHWIGDSDFYRAELPSKMHLELESNCGKDRGEFLATLHFRKYVNITGNSFDGEAQCICVMDKDPKKALKKLEVEVQKTIKNLTKLTCQK